MKRREFIACLGGAAAAWPLYALGQQGWMPVIGFMSGRAPEDSAYLLAAFRQGLREGGFVEGRNLVIEYRWARGDYARLPELAADLVGRRVSVLVGVGGDPSARAARTTTSTIPVVFGMGGDPVAAGLVKSINRPGGNATGFTLLTSEMEQKRLGLLHEMLPGVSYGVLLNPNLSTAARQLRDLEEAAGKLRLRLHVTKAGNDVELDAAFGSLTRERVGAMLVAADPFLDTRRARIIAFATEHRLPAIYQFREYATDGGLISYGPSIADSYRQAGVYAARILKGAKPAELPVVQPTKFDFVINLKAAKAIGFDIPPAISARADEVIE